MGVLHLPETGFDLGLGAVGGDHDRCLCRIGIHRGRFYDVVLAISRSDRVADLLSSIGHAARKVALVGVAGTPAADDASVLDFADERSVVQTRYATMALRCSGCTSARTSSRTAQSPLTLTSWRSRCRISTRSAQSAITWSMSLYAAGISSRNAGVSRNSIPAIALRN